MIGFSCDELQGFFFSQPMPAGKVQAFLQSHRNETGAIEAEYRPALRPLAAA
jgi:hypothetical protein